jgi:hypothetical protein
LHWNKCEEYKTAYQVKDYCDIFFLFEQGNHAGPEQVLQKKQTYEGAHYQENGERMRFENIVTEEIEKKPQQNVGDITFQSYDPEEFIERDRCKYKKEPHEPFARSE